jgi:hypothetical protein
VLPTQLIDPNRRVSSRAGRDLPRSLTFHLSIGILAAHPQDTWGNQIDWSFAFGSMRIPVTDIFLPRQSAPHALLQRLSTSSPSFYPIDNTPALWLTQDLPCEQGADILFLRCGDVRNSLFTTDSDTKFSLSTWLGGHQNHCLHQTEPRRLDITCGDIEIAILGIHVSQSFFQTLLTVCVTRTILLFTILLDDREGQRDTAIGNIHYHLFLDAKSLEHLMNQ